METRAFLSAPGARFELPEANAAEARGSSATLKIVRALFLSKEVWMQNILVFLAARAGVWGGLYPFGAALFSGALLAHDRRMAVAAAASLTLGTATLLSWPRTLAVLTAAVLALVIFRPRRGEPARGEGRRSGVRILGRVIAAALIFAGARLAFEWGDGYGLYGAAKIAAEAGLIAVAGVIAYPAAACRWFGGSARHDRGSLVALGLLISLCGLGLAGVGWNAFRADEVWNRWVTLVAALVGGAAGGAAVGTSIGVLTALSGLVPLGGTGLYGVAGLLAGVFARKGKPGAAAGYVLGEMIASASAPAADEILLGALHTGLALVLLSFTPNRWIARMRRGIPGSEAHIAAQLSREARLREAINERLRQIGSVFAELADVFAKGGGGAARPAWDEEGIHALIEQVWQRQCKACSGFRECWQSQFYQSYWETVDLVALLEKKGSVSAGDLSRDFKRRCFREKEFAGALERAWQHCREGRAGGIDLVPEQLRGAARLVENVAGQVKLDTSRAEELEGLLRDEFAVKGIAFEDVRVRLAGERADVEVAYSGPCDGYGSCAVQLLSIVERVMGERYTCEPECRSPLESVCRVRLVPEPPTILDVKWARLAKGETAVSGDSYAKFELGGGRVALALSDGMGAGGRAAEGSRAAVGLLEKMMRAGFDREFATRTVNAALLARSEEDGFATLDLAVVDQFTGDVEFIKVGASPTFIKRAGGVEIVRSNSLPVGILSDIEVRPEAARLAVGDALVMMTDGVLDSLPRQADKEEWIARTLRRVDTCNPSELVRLIVDRARQAAGGEVRDDMTVLVAQLQYRPRHSELEEPGFAGTEGYDDPLGPGAAGRYAGAAL